MRGKIIKLLEETVEFFVTDSGVSKDFYYSQPPKPRTVQGETDVLECIKIKEFCLTKNRISHHLSD